MTASTAVRCAQCPFRSKYDQNPRSLVGRIWRWHINWCPGWKMYMKSLPQEERDEIIQKYSLKYIDKK
ncbi:MAG: hypothetical protein N3F66_07900 [Spirochaetes bacterium]|nr:hypothetical protein [Spirochaetota bacterium]